MAVIQKKTIPFDTVANAVPITGGGGGGGGAATIADGADVAEGATTDAAVTTDANGTVSSKLRGLIVVLLRAFQLATPIRTDPTNATATTIADGGGSITIDAAALPLPSGASTSAKQPALGTAGTPSADVISVQGVASGTVLPANVSQIAGTTPALNTGTRSAGTLRVTVATDDVVPASQNGTWTVQPGNTANTTPWLVTDTPAASGGLSKFHLVSAASTNATNVKASAGQVFCITAFNLNASPRYLKFHNTSGTPTAGSGVTDTYMIPGNAVGAGVVINIDKGVAFATGIGISIVTGITDADATAVAASEIVVNIYYK